METRTETFVEAVARLSSEVEQSLNRNAPAPKREREPRTPANAHVKTFLKDRTFEIRGLRVRVCHRMTDASTADVLVAGRYAGTVRRSPHGFDTHKPDAAGNRYCPQPEFTRLENIEASLEFLVHNAIATAAKR